jgi:hypothetical protein
VAFTDPITSLPFSALTGQVDPASQIAPGTLAGGILLPTGQLSGLVTDAQIAALAASKLTAGALAAGVTLAASQLAGAVLLTQLATGALPAGITLPSGQLIGLVPTTQLSGQVTAAQITANASGTGERAAGAVTTGILAAGAVTAGIIAAGAIDGQTITGALIRTAAAGQRWEITGTPSNHITGYSGVTSETPGYLEVTSAAGAGPSAVPVVNLTTGTAPGVSPAAIQLLGEDPGAANPAASSRISLNADTLALPALSYGVIGPNVWSFSNDVRIGTAPIPRGIIGKLTGPTIQTDCTALVTLISFLPAWVIGRTYLIGGHFNGSQITAASNVLIRIATDGNLGLPPNLADLTASPNGTKYNYSGAYVWTCTATNPVLYMQALSSAGAVRVPVNGCQLYVIDQGV